MQLRCLIVLSLMIAGTAAIAEPTVCAADALEARVPSSLGDKTMAPVMDALLAGYRKAHPELAPPQRWSHPGDAAAMGAVMFEVADMAPITRSFTATELAPYDHQYRGDMIKAPTMVLIGSVGGRPAWIAVNKRPDSPMVMRINAFLTFALSDAGQNIVASIAHARALVPDERVQSRADLGGFVAALDAELPDYRRIPKLSGAIRSVGSDGMKDLMDGWQCRFRALQPSTRKGERWEHFGTLNGFHALMVGEADIAPMGRELWPEERAAWQSLFGTPAPVEIMVARGGFNTPQRTTAQAIFVNPANPLKLISVAQLAAVMGANPAITRWGQLGLTGEWANRPIHVRMPPRITPNAMSMQIMVLNGQSWASGAKEGTLTETANAILDDPAAIGFGGLEEGDPKLHTLAIATRDGGPYVALNAASASSGRYPLTRGMFIRLAPGPTPPQVKAFLRYILSREGQERVRYSGYFPLSATEAQRELAKLR